MDGEEMPPKPKPTKTERILSIYHLFRYCDEVSMQELTSQLPGSKKTFSRDIAILKKAGFAIRYSVRQQAFVLDEKPQTTHPPADNKAEQIFIEKIMRLTTVMDNIPAVDCDKWYADTFPNTSKRTMQRDFAVLNAIGYTIKYERDGCNYHDAGMDVPPRHYYCDKPHGAYELTTFGRNG